ncbi:MAG: YkgJ family cysteine cluster protein [Methylophilus sp.]|nr:YkgJ family cysteine cluster protein [Methylophilus sp.]
MANRTPEQTRQFANVKLDEFFNTVPPELKAHVVTLPKRVTQISARPVIRLKEVLNTADQIFDYAGKFAACARGCGHCCHVSVPITQLEARYMGENLGITPVEIKQSIKHELTAFGSHTPCPFLKNGECSIYAFRPLTCRMHMNFDQDNYWCLHENWQRPEAEIPRPTIQPLIDAYHVTISSVAPIMADIRDFFPNGKAES